MRVHAPWAAVLVASLTVTACESDPTATLSPTSSALSTTPSVTVTFTDFSDLSGFQLNGVTPSINPATYGGQPVLRLTNALSQAGSAFLKNAIPLEDESGFKASFSTAFSFQITDPEGISDEDGQGADGIVFVVQTVSNTAGGFGEGIGYRGIARSLGVEFDTWNNAGQDNYSGNHVGINLNGDPNSVLRANIPTPMNNGAPWFAWVDYDGDAELLVVRLSESSTRPDSPLMSYSVDLAAVLAQPEAFIGFTSGTGAAGGDHDIRSWQFTNTLAPIEEIGNVAPIADAGDGQILECAGPSGAQVILDGSGSSDSDGSIVSYAWTDADGNAVASGATPTITLATGVHTLTLTVTDDDGATASDEVTIEVADETPPTINFALSTTELWSPNHKMVTVATGISATDPCSGGATAVEITVTSNEPVNGTGDGDTGPDWLVVDRGNGTYDLQVRSERTGAGSGRVYSIVVKATDAAGNVSTQTGQVRVPSDKRK